MSDKNTNIFEKKKKQKENLNSKPNMIEVKVMKYKHYKAVVRKIPLFLTEQQFDDEFTNKLEIPFLYRKFIHVSKR